MPINPPAARAASQYATASGNQIDGQDDQCDHQMGLTLLTHAQRRFQIAHWFPLAPAIARLSTAGRRSRRLKIIEKSEQN
jgi:hypothetical protein